MQSPFPFSGSTSSSSSLTANETAEWTNKAALLDPAAYTYWVGAGWEVTVPAGETWLVVNAWQCKFSTSTGRWFHRELKTSEAVEIGPGTVIASIQDTSFLYVCRPALVTDDAKYDTPKALYFERINALRALDADFLNAEMSAGQSTGTIVTTDFPTDFDDGIALQAASHDIAWVILREPAATSGLNTLNEISDDDKIRFTGKLLAPFQRHMFPNIAIRNAGALAGSGHFLYHKLPSSWRAATKKFYQTDVLVDAPILYYPLDEKSGAVVEDVSGNSQDGATSGAGITWGRSGPIGDNGSALKLSNATDGHVEIPTTAGLDFGAGDFTIEGWFYLVSTASVATANPWIVNGWSMDTGAPNSFLVAMFSNRLRLHWRNTGGTVTTVDSTVALVNNTYYHFIAGRDGSNIFIRLVGAEARQTAAVSGDMASLGANKVWLGEGWDNGAGSLDFRVNGALDEIAFYDKALTDARAESHKSKAIGW